MQQRGCVLGRIDQMQQAGAGTYTDEEGERNMPGDESVPEQEQTTQQIHRRDNFLTTTASHAEHRLRQD